MAVSASGRRTPVQSRSQQTVQRVLDAASSLLTQMPLEDVTTTRIAAEAGLSIGALYRFFPDKQTIIDAIAVRHVEQFRASLEATVMPALERELANLETFDPAQSSRQRGRRLHRLSRRPSRLPHYLLRTLHQRGHQASASRRPASGCPPC